MISDKEFGELIGKVDSIKENTDKIPTLAIAVAKHEVRISNMEPMVDSHEKTSQRAVGMAMVTGLLAGCLSWIVRDSSH